MSDAEIEQKCTDLLQPVLGAEYTKSLIDRIRNLEKVRSMAPSFRSRQTAAVRVA
jgi:hypothetical protein